VGRFLRRLFPKEKLGSAGLRMGETWQVRSTFRGRIRLVSRQRRIGCKTPTTLDDEDPRPALSGMQIAWSGESVTFAPAHSENHGPGRW
jgi:hypothetical protein